MGHSADRGIDGNRMTLPAGTSELIARAYADDLGATGDVTTESVIEIEARATGDVVARTRGCVAGVEVAAACFRHLDDTLTVEVLVDDGDAVEPGDVIITVSGRARSILAAERVALNFLGHLSGVATATRTYVEAIAGTGARISDTRKTTPGYRALEKHAVAAGGGRNHRMGLHDAVLIKDNHIAAAGSITDAVAAVRDRHGDRYPVEVEVDTLDQLREVLVTATDVVLLDNMSTDELATAVAMVDGRMTTEASGGIDLDTVRAVAETGVDVISVGWITHSAPSLDVALDVKG